MILSVSRRTDVPSFYADWFFRRLAEGFVLVRNPMNPRSVARIALTPEVLDGIVFWTKNPAPMLDRLPLLAAYPYYFQFTVTPYGQDLETAVPRKGREIVPVFQRLADRIGPSRVLWRYDPVLLSPKYTEAYHAEAFDGLARRLSGYTERCTFSFIDPYRSTKRNAARLRLEPMDEACMRRIARTLRGIAEGYGIAPDACAETLDLSAEGVGRAACVDAALLSRIGGVPLRAARDKNQRLACGCSASIDIGQYNTCRNGCLYCYANYDAEKIPRNVRAHDPLSPLLVGRIGPEDRVYARDVTSCADPQTRLFPDT